MREWTITQLQTAYRRGETDPLTVCRHYLERIEEIDKRGPAINAIIEINPDAAAIAEARAEEPPGGRLLYGVPVLLKDNIDTRDRMKTTAGSLALTGAPTPEDAFLVRRLREEGAVILGKTNLSEWANFRSTRSNSGWSSRGGQTRNPYVLDRSPCGSSSGSAAAIAANLAVCAVGTETDGSVTCPSAHNSLVGLKPSVGSVSRSGIIPISASQDSAGPMARSVADAALLLQAMAGHDTEDAASFPAGAYRAHLGRDYLRGKRIGVARKQAKIHRGTEAPFAEALHVLAAAGAELVEQADLPDAHAVAAHELTVLRYEFKQGLADYFARRAGSSAGSGDRGGSGKAGAAGGGPRSAMRSIDDIIAFNEQHRDAVLKLFGQEQMEEAAKCGPLTDTKYRKALEESRRMSGADGIDALLHKKRLDAIVAPTNAPAWLIDHLNGDYYSGGAMSSIPAIAGYPHITVPMGYHHGLPLGISFVGGFKTDAELLGIAHAYERASAVRRRPRFQASIGLLG